MASPATPPSPVGSGQLPGAGRSEASAEVGGDADEIEADLQPRMLEPALGQEPPAPEGGRRERGDGAEPQHLHDDIGGDRARGAEQIVDRRVGRVIEARIGDGPGEERKAERADASERAEAQDLGRPAFRKLAQRRGQIVENREGRRTHGSLVGPCGEVCAPPLADPMRIELMRA